MDRFLKILWKEKKEKEKKLRQIQRKRKNKRDIEKEREGKRERERERTILDRYRQRKNRKIEKKGRYPLTNFCIKISNFIPPPPVSPTYARLG